MAFELPPYFQENFPFLQGRRWVASAAAFVAGVVVLVVYFQAEPKAASYVQAEETFARWETSPADESLYREMKQALKKVPALEEKYEAPIAQGLLNGDKAVEALEIAEHSLEGLREEAPFHAAFGETSLLIEQGAFQEALERAVSLKEQMAQDWNLEALRSGAPLAGGAILYAQNLLRIACLQKEVGNQPGEKAAWEEFETFVGTEGPIANLIYGNFKEKNADLSGYIAERKKAL